VTALPISREQYADYLRSEEWAKRREKVMQRARLVCEGCCTQPATEVHHLTYAHITQEFLFELVAMCGDCHARWHGQPTRPKSTWTPRHTGRPQAKESPGAQQRRGLLSKLAAEARAKFMAADLPAPPAPTAERVAELAAAKREGRPAAEYRDVAEANHG
jgi:hypothetical protein